MHDQLDAHGHEQVITIDAGLFGDLNAKEDNNIPVSNLQDYTSSISNSAGSILNQELNFADPLSPNAQLQNNTNEDFDNPELLTRHSMLTPATLNMLEDRLQDIGMWPQILSAAEKERIIKCGPVSIEAEYSFPTKKNGRKFTNYHCTRTMKMVKLLREPGLCIQNVKMLYIVFVVNYCQILTLICLDQVVVIGNT